MIAWSLDTARKPDKELHWLDQSETSLVVCRNLIASLTATFVIGHIDVSLVDSIGYISCLKMVLRPILWTSQMLGLESLLGGSNTEEPWISLFNAAVTLDSVVGGQKRSSRFIYCICWNLIGWRALKFAKVMKPAFLCFSGHLNFV